MEILIKEEYDKIEKFLHNAQDELNECYHNFVNINKTSISTNNNIILIPISSVSSLAEKTTPSPVIKTTHDINCNLNKNIIEAKKKPALGISQPFPALKNKDAKFVCYSPSEGYCSIDLNSELNYSLNKLNSLSTTSSNTMQSSNNILYSKLFEDEHEDQLLSSSLSIYDNLSIYTLNNDNNTEIDPDDTDNDKESIISNYDDHIYEPVQSDYSDHEFKKTQNQIVINNINTESKNSSSLDNIFNRISLECEKTIEQCRIMIQSVSNSQNKSKYNKNLLKFDKNSLSASSSTSLSSSSSVAVPPLIKDYNRKIVLPNCLLKIEEKERFNKKKKKFRKKIKKNKTAILENFDSNDEDLSQYENKNFQKRRVKNCPECEKRSLSCIPYGENESLNKSKSRSNYNYRVDFKTSFQANSIHLKFPSMH